VLNEHNVKILKKEITVNRYTQTEEGNWLDNQTGLIWKSMPEEGYFTYEEALNLQSAEWRLPTIRELLSIVDSNERNPATLLPDHDSYIYWSASPYFSNSRYAWYVTFFHGYDYFFIRNFNFRVRLVRGDSLHPKHDVKRLI
jgi:hypothetical protein